MTTFLIDRPALTVDLFRSARRNEDFPRLDDADLGEAIDRYVRFLILCAKHPNRPLSPTKDIDLVWHLHMLSPRGYVRDCEMIFGEVLDHDGGFGAGDEEPELRRVFAETADLWALEYAEPYVGDSCGNVVRCTRNCESRCKRKCST